jgi:hypothetical protein
VGKKVELSIGEPWDFESPDGQGILRGEIVSVSGAGGEPADQRVTLKVTPFGGRVGEKRIDRLVASARYEDERGILEHLARGEDAEVNFDYSDQIPEEERESRSLPFLIGGFHLIRE